MSKEISAESNTRKGGSWTNEQHQQFINALLLFGRDWSKFQDLIPTRNGTQIRSHAQKFFNKLENQFESRDILGSDSVSIMGPPDIYETRQETLLFLTILLSVLFFHFYNLVKPKLCNKYKNKSKAQVNQNNHQNSYTIQQSYDNNSFNFQYFPNNTKEYQNNLNESFFNNNFYKNMILLDSNNRFYQQYVDVQFIDEININKRQIMMIQEHKINSQTMIEKDIPEVDWQDTRCN